MSRPSLMPCAASYRAKMPRTFSASGGESGCGLHAASSTIPARSKESSIFWKTPARKVDSAFGPITPMPTDEIKLAPEHFLSLIQRQQRGVLKIYLGFAAGVGKTYEMLQEGRRLKRKGVDVVIGFIETHGRAETAAQIGDLDQVPRRRIEYHGVALEEMDLDAILARRPTVCLVDELAHTNAPGSRNPKRYQDVEELMRAGINVLTTMNIQHLESLYDVIERFAGVKVKERVPDYILNQADQIVNVDLSAEDLQERLKGGK